MTDARAASRRRATYGRGLSGEAFALGALMLKGYRPLGRRFAAAGGEIDLIVRRGDTIAFVEVKARSEMGTARGSIDGRKQGRFSRAARVWIARHPGLDGVTFRADAVFVAAGAWPQHVPDAFPLEAG